jgi:hypothetical protein
LPDIVHLHKETKYHSDIYTQPSKESNLPKEKIILGIDPGTTIMGYGLIKVVDKKMSFMQLNELMLTKYSDHYTKLKIDF